MLRFDFNQLLPDIFNLGTTTDGQYNFVQSFIADHEEDIDNVMMEDALSGDHVVLVYCVYFEEGVLVGCLDLVCYAFYCMGLSF